jgi:hypothetical protein
LEKIGAIERAGAHVHEHLAGARLGAFDIT